MSNRTQVLRSPQRGDAQVLQRIESIRVAAVIAISGHRPTAEGHVTQAASQAGIALALHPRMKISVPVQSAQIDPRQNEQRRPDAVPPSESEPTNIDQVAIDTELPKFSQEVLSSLGKMLSASSGSTPHPWEAARQAKSAPARPPAEQDELDEDADVIEKIQESQEAVIEAVRKMTEDTPSTTGTIASAGMAR